MIVYFSHKQGFLKDVDSNQIDKIVADNFLRIFRTNSNTREILSWRNSLPYMANILRDSEIPEDVGVAVECKIMPPSGKRIDFMLSGTGPSKEKHVIIVELKQWQEAEKTEMDGIVVSRLGGNKVRTSHPSYQAYTYRCLLKGFNESVYETSINVGACGYLHNCDHSEDLIDERYGRYLLEAPLFFRPQVEALRGFIKARIKLGDRGKVIQTIDKSKVRPSSGLADSVVGLLKGNNDFVLIDEQKVVFEEALQLVNLAEAGKKKVFIVQGGPGTGKSVVAINLLGELIGKRRLVHYVSRNSAPRDVYAHKLSGSRPRGEIKSLFRNSWAYIDAETDGLDCLLVDEAHRLNEKSGLYGNLGEHQIKEIIHASKCSVFFIDEDQRVSLKDIGTKEEIRFWATHHKADVIEAELPSQFRCNGSDGYIAWLDNVLGIRETENKTLADIEYDFQVFDSPQDLREAILAKNQSNKARLLAGYCWPWKSKANSSAYDITFPEFRFQMRWNLREDGNLWLINPSAIDQIGCIHTCQGLELDYVGVIIGPDLAVNKEGSLITQPEARAKDDKTIRGWRQMAKESPDKAKTLTDRIIKNTYRVLMTRGMKGCYVFTADGLLRERFKTACIKSDKL